MCDVVFITPNIEDSIHYESMGTLLLATILKENGINTKVWNLSKFGDINDFDNYINNAIKEIENVKPKIVSFYTRCDFYHVDLRLAEAIKQHIGDIYIVFGGPQADITAEDTVKKIPYVDFVCCGEGEKTIYPFFSSLLQKNPDLSIDGLVYRDGENVIKNPRPEMLDELDSLPLIDYSLAECGDMRVNKLFPIEVGRGCPFGCTFCSTKSFWGRKYRLKTAKRIFEEVKVINQTLGVTRFNFLHDMFTFNRKNVIEICELLKTLDFPIKWACSARLDCLDTELIDIMVASNLTHVYFGIETGSPRMQKLINKRLKLEYAPELIGYLDRKGVKVTVSFIYGFPEESEEDISQTLDLIAKLIKFKNVKVQAHLCAFLSKTELTEKYQAFLTPTEQYSNVTGDLAINECNNLIKLHPKLFEQMMEYKTELRSKLKYFEIFIKMWECSKPIYNYIAELYDHRLFDMYCDFFASNSQSLDTISQLDLSKANKIIVDDKFLLRFKDDVNYDIISDFAKLQSLLYLSTKEQNGNNMTVISFDANYINKNVPIGDYPRGKYIVVCNNGKLACFPQK